MKTEQFLKASIKVAKEQKAMKATKELEIILHMHMVKTYGINYIADGKA